MKRHLPFLVLVLWASTLATGAHAKFHQAEDASEADQETLLLADEVSYDDDANTVTANGFVEIQRGKQLLLADKIVYDRNTDIATATGHVSLLDDSGTVVYAEKIEVSGDLKQGLSTEVRVLLSDKSRMAGRAFRRVASGVNELYEAAYTPCDSCASDKPLWQIKASRVRHDHDEQMVYYNDAWLEIAGVPVFYTPYLAHPDPASGAKTGLLLPSFGVSRNLGAFYKQPYFISIDENRDATLTPLLTSEAGKGAEVEYRQNFANARVRIEGSVVGGDPDLDKDARGHVKAWARWDLDENWRAGTDINFASDQTYLRRYAFDTRAWLVSDLFAERFDTHSYFSANSYYFQRQRAPVPGAVAIPVVAPLLNYSFLSDSDGLGGYWSADANGFVLFRKDGSDTDRLSARVGWNLPYTSSYGAVYTFRAGVRGDGYYVHKFLRPSTGSLFTGTVGRFVPEASLEWRMPFASDQFGIHQVLEPIAMAVISRHNINSDAIPNEDSIDLEFDDTNLFGANRFSGYDRVETGARVNYGLHWTAFNADAGTVSALVGQSYRFHNDPIFTPLSGLAGHRSDIVGHVDVTPNPYLSLQYRFRLDKDSLGSRRADFTASAGPSLLRISAGYLFVKGLPTQPPLPGSTEEFLAGVSSRFSQQWTVTASHRRSLASGGAVYTNVGLAYEDECFMLSLNFSKSNTQDRDFKRGAAVLLRVNFKTIGDFKFNTDFGPGN